MMFKETAGPEGSKVPVGECSSQRRILWVDDEIAEGRAEVRWLTHAGFAVVCAQNADAALAILDQDSFDAMLMDLKMPGKSGMELLDELADRKSRIPVVVLTGFGTMDLAVAAMKLGAIDVSSKAEDRRGPWPTGTSHSNISANSTARIRSESGIRDPAGGSDSAGARR